ncbi:hypothetical protein BLA29_012328 [Euroglyphus maynei]|uniref:Uncharacterized protein n=1 Tax=Euroglyphus maynei TaxID=6958 RepID=A0A1Y3BVY2_EURMA|nr:hypothetical protein BLA29_012328 [Euroglyphus maynei]
MTLKRPFHDVNDDDQQNNQEQSISRTTFDSPSKRKRNNVHLLKQFPTYLVKINPFISMTSHSNESKSVPIMGASICHQCKLQTINNTKMCDFCDHKICHDCQQLCLHCHRYFCGLCSIRTYDYSNECSNVAICFNCNR